MLDPDNLREIMERQAAENARLRQVLVSAHAILATARVLDDPPPRYLLDEIVANVYQILDTALEARDA